MATPRDAQAFPYQPDPSDELDYAVDVSAIFGDEDLIDPSTVSVTLPAESAAIGLRIASTSEKLPRLSADGFTIVFWLTVADELRAAGSWRGFGRDVPVTVAFATIASPVREYERDFVVTVRNR